MIMRQRLQHCLLSIRWDDDGLKQTASGFALCMVVPFVQAEVDDILRDAASKLNKFKEMAQKQREGGGASDALVKALTDRHERDRLVATAELESIRKQYAAKEKDLESEYAEKLSSVKVWHALVVGQVCLPYLFRPE